jgi:hypothetical protein
MLNLIDAMVDSFGGLKEMIRWKCLAGEFKNVFNDLSKLAFRDFMKGMIEPVIAMNYWNNFLKNITRQKVSGRLFKKCGKFLAAKSAISLLVDLENALNRREDAILALIDHSTMHDSWTRRYHLSQQLESLCTKEIEERKNGKRAEKVSDRVLSDVLMKAGLVKAFSKDCKLGFDKRFELLKNEQMADHMAYGALFMKKYSLALRLAELRPGSLAGVVDRYVELLWMNQKYAKCLQKMASRVSGGDYEVLTLHFLMALEKKIGKTKEFSKLIMENLRDNRLLVKLLIKFGFLREARDHCTDANTLAVIENAAREARDTALVAEIKKSRQRGK